MRTLVALLLLWPALGYATPDDPAQPAPPTPPVEEPAPAPTEPAAEEPVDEDVQEQVDDLQKDLQRVKHSTDALRREVKSQAWLLRFITVYVDVGAFTVGGDGSGIRSDIGHVYYPQYMGTVPGQWVFMGDPLSTAINTLGEPSDTSNSREVPVDTVDSEGHPSLIVNTIGLAIGKHVTDHISIASLAELLPRAHDNLLDIQTAVIEYRTPVGDGNVRINAGKIESVLGIEYRKQDAFNRLGVTPSLIGRYTSGRPLGVRAELTRGRLSTFATITNGNNFQTLFEHDTQLKANSAPTGSAHVQWLFPFGRHLDLGEGLELGVSGAFGPQDNQPSIDVTQWHIGFDAKLTNLHGFDASAEYVQGKQEGHTTNPMAPCDDAACLTYKGAYLLVSRPIRPWFTPYGRVDWRDAVHIHGAEFVYESHTVRGTLGAHFEMTSRIIAKIEYTWNHELGNIPQFANDILTSSLVVATD